MPIIEKLDSEFSLRFLIIPENDHRCSNCFLNDLFPINFRLNISGS